VQGKRQNQEIGSAELSHHAVPACGMRFVSLKIKAAELQNNSALHRCAGSE
jgi:hypothetical protein